MKKSIVKIDDVLRQLDYGIDCISRTIYIEDEITLVTPNEISAKIATIINATGNYKTPITLQITTHGGELYGMLGAIDIIQRCKMPIITLGVGAVMSAGALILASGTKRLVTENTILMVHEMSGWMEGNSGDIMTETKQWKNIQQKIYELLTKFSKQPIEFWKRNCVKNLYLTSKEALEYGLIDGIV